VHNNDPRFFCAYLFSLTRTPVSAFQTLNVKSSLSVDLATLV
jgi:hypothetical protein